MGDAKIFKIPGPGLTYGVEVTTISGSAITLVKKLNRSLQTYYTVDFKLAILQSCRLQLYVVFWLPSSLLHPMRSKAARKPHTMAAHSSTTEQPPVMAANPPNNPLHMSVTFQWPERRRFLNSVVSTAVDPASVVVTAVLPIPLIGRSSNQTRTERGSWRRNQG